MFAVSLEMATRGTLRGWTRPTGSSLSSSRCVRSDHGKTETEAGVRLKHGKTSEAGFGVQ